jgi:hypothetical protein
MSHGAEKAQEEVEEAAERSGKLPATSSGPKTPIIERTDTKGLVQLEVPWVGGRIKTTWPATNRSVMVVICTLLCMLTVVVPACCYIIFMGANPENLSSFGELFGSSEMRKPEKVQVKTGNGIEMIEVCPPCDRDCRECMGECPVCPTCPVCPVCPTVAPALEKTAPLRP